MTQRSFLRVLDDDVEFQRLKAAFLLARESRQFPSLRPDDPCAGFAQAPPAVPQEVDLDAEKWGECGHTLEHGLRASVDHGLLSEMPSQEAMARALQEEGTDLDPFHHWFALMRAGRRAIMFDSETSTFPNRHDELILEEFGSIQPGAFGPIDAAECWHQGAEQSDGHYDVAFGHGGRWYHFAARNFSDWFDIDAVAHAVSAAMADAGVAESFHRVSTDSQGAYFILATVKDIQEFSRALRRRGDSSAAAGFLALPAIFPTIALRPADVGADPEARLLDLACRMAKGQRVLVVDTPDGQANRSLVPTIDSMARQHPELMVRLFSFGTDLRLVWSRPIPANVQLVDATHLSPSEQITALGSQMRQMHALVARGQDVLLFVPWLSRLGAPMGDVTQLDLNWFKEFFGTGRNCASGSLTLLASVPDGPDEPMDRLLIQELGRMANAELWFSTAGTTQTPYPPVDFARSSVQREGLLLTEGEQAGRNALRAKIRTLALGDRAAFVWEKLGLFPSTDELLKSMVAESPVQNSQPPSSETPTPKPSLWRRLFG